MVTAVLFASEHGSWWDVGLLAGLAYNWWMLRTKTPRRLHPGARGDQWVPGGIRGRTGEMGVLVK